MDILKILNEGSKDLMIEDLDYFIVELDTGDYDADYISQCKKLIKQIRYNKTRGNIASISRNINELNLLNTKKDKNIVPNDIFLFTADINNKGLDDNQIINKVTYDLNTIRSSENSRQLFKKYVKSNDLIFKDDFIDNNFSIFSSWEKDIILTYADLPESFLEKHLDDLNIEILSRHQRLSESFIQKHFASLDIKKCIQNKKNEWLDKNKRSKQFDLFLRLKGYKL